MLRPPLPLFAMAALGLLLGVVVLIMGGYSRQLLRDNERLSVEAARSRSAADAAQSRLLQIEQSAASARDKLAQESRALHTLREENAVQRSALAKALNEAGRLRGEKAAALLAAEEKERAMIGLEGELGELRRRLSEVQSTAQAPVPAAPPAPVASVPGVRTEPAATDHPPAAKESEARQGISPAPAAAPARQESAARGLSRVPVRKEVRARPKATPPPPQPQPQSPSIWGQ